MPRFSVTYNTITTDSAAAGDYADQGWVEDGGSRSEDPGPHEITLRDAVRAFGPFSEDCGRWFATVDPDVDYRTDEDTFYQLHPPRTITASSYGRLRRLLGAR